VLCIQAFKSPAYSVKAGTNGDTQSKCFLPTIVKTAIWEVVCCQVGLRPKFVIGAFRDRDIKLFSTMYLNVSFKL